MTDAELIKELGGARAVAKLCDVSTAAVHAWARNGIPRARVLHLRVVRPDLFPIPQEPIMQSAGTVAVPETTAYVLAPGVGIAFVKLP